MSLDDKLRTIRDLNTRLSVDQTRKRFNAKQVEYQLIQELLFDMAYDSELGFLSTKENELYNQLSDAWTSAHLQMHQPDPRSNPFQPLGGLSANLSRDHVAIFQSRMNDKLNQRLELIFMHLSAEDYDILTLLEEQKLDALVRLRRIQTEFIEAISVLCTAASHLFIDIRTKTQPKVTLHTADVLLTQAESLLAQVVHMDLTVQHEARKPSDTSNYLRKTRSELDVEFLAIKTEVEQLEAALSDYHRQDADYHDIVQRFKECQEQLDVGCDLFQHKDVVSRSGTPGRRSLSLGSLPNLYETTHR